MTKYEILLPTDGSECARKAEVAAMKIAKSYNIRMAAIFVAVAKKDSQREELGVSMQRMPKKGARAEIIAHSIL